METFTLTSFEGTVKKVVFLINFFVDDIDSVDIVDLFRYSNTRRQLSIDKIVTKRLNEADSSDVMYTITYCILQASQTIASEAGKSPFFFIRRRQSSSREINIPNQFSHIDSIKS